MSLYKMALMRHAAQLKMPFAQVRIKKTTVCPFQYPSDVSLPPGDVILAKLAARPPRMTSFFVSLWNN